MKLLCYGGTFNPIHHGHLIVAQAAADAGGFERVVLVPSAQPPHKLAGPDLADAEDRLTMCQSAVENVSRFAVTDLELKRAGPSFTLDTVRALRGQGWDEVYWLIGGDTVPQLARWHQPDALMREARFLVAARPGWALDWESLPEPYRSLRRSVVPAPLIDISATDVRRRVAAGAGIDFLVPPAVAAFIRAKGLYRRRDDD